MGYYQKNLQLFLYFAVVISVSISCAPQVQQPMRICPGKDSIDEAVSALRLNLENIVPFKANGRCHLVYYDEGKKHKESFPIKLWVNPPDEIYFQGDVPFDPQGIVIGCNQKEFWLALKPKEISTYWYGQFSEQDYSGQLLVSPKLLLEAMGVVSIDSQQENQLNWLLSNEGIFDVLVGRNEQGAIIKKIYIYCCDYLVRKIEYFQGNGQLAMVAELDRYKQFGDDFFVPRVIKIANLTKNTEGIFSITINLKSIKPAKFTDKQRSRLFIRPSPKGFKHIYRIINGNVIEQSF